MTLQRCLLQVSKQYISRHSLLPNVKQMYCPVHHMYSTKPPMKFTDRHEWVVVDKDIGTVGISDYLQETLGDVVFAQLPEVGKNVTAGNECGTLESVKAASELYSPVTGIITEKNGAVEKKPALINSSCYNKGWLFKLKMTKPDEVKKLMNEDQYLKYLKTDVIKD